MTEATTLESKTMEKVSRVLVVDDSAYVRKVIRQMLSRSPFLEVIGVARDGVEALELIEQLRPDVVTVDLMMPNMDGVAFMREQMARHAIPGVIVSIAGENGEMALRALDAGAVDFVQKPTALATEKVFEMADELIEKVKMAANAHVKPLVAAPGSYGAAPAAVKMKGRADILLIGVSTGGPQALKEIIPALPREFPIPVAIVLHMPVGYTQIYAEKLNEISELTVVEAREGMPVVPGTVILAQAGRHLIFKRGDDGDVRAHLGSKPFDTPHRPSVDVMFRSAADVYGEKVLAVVMTGMGSDGQQGAAWIKAKGGSVITQSESSCVVYGMPRSVDEAGLSDRSVPLGDLVSTIIEVA